MNAEVLNRHILIVTKQDQIFLNIQEYLSEGHILERAQSKDECKTKFLDKECDFIFYELNLLVSKDSIDKSALKHELDFFFNNFPLAQIIILCQKNEIRKAAKVVQSGAANYLAFPIIQEDLNLVMEGASDQVLVEAELDYLRDTFWKDDTEDVVGTKSPAMKDVFDKVKAVAPTRSNVLLTGETGVGKGVLARLIHRYSSRGDSQFVSVHCGAIPETLLESELFGHEKGSFTGADKKKLGYFEIAHGGTIFLDEIATISHSTQIKLLQVLQERIFRRVGGQSEIEADVRIIAATNDNLKELVEARKFRSDLYYRLNVFPINIPPLRDRINDLSLLLDKFLENLNKYGNKDISGIHPEVLNALKVYSWPGNIRELENLIERAYVLETTKILTPESFPSDIFNNETVVAEVPIKVGETLASIRERVVEHAERQYLKELLQQNFGRIDKSAEIAGISTRQLHKLLTKYSIRKEDFKERK